MTTPKMHADELDIDVGLVRRLVACQFPQWADLDLRSVESAGTDNAIFRLGDELAVRLPRLARARKQVDSDQTWLPLLAPHLPLAVPVPIARGEPGEGYPWSWSVGPWIAGEVVTDDRLADLDAAAGTLAEFVLALQAIDPAGGPPAGPPNSHRGIPLSWRDEPTRKALDQLHDLIDVDAATTAWDAALRASPWTGDPVWLHGDLSPLNLLANAEGALHAVIDFGCVVIGDPAGDLIVAWNLFSGSSREMYRAALGVDEDTWARGKGWALSIGLIALPYYRVTNPVLADNALLSIEAVLTDD